MKTESAAEAIHPTGCSDYSGVDRINSVDSVRQVSCQNPQLGNREKMAEDWEKARDWLMQKSITRISAKVTRFLALLGALVVVVF